MNPAIWAWIVLVVVINAYWTVYDFVLAKPRGWLTMSSQFHRWLYGQASGPFLFGAMVFVVAVFSFHMFRTK